MHSCLPAFMLVTIEHKIGLYSHAATVHTLTPSHQDHLNFGMVPCKPCGYKYEE